MKQFYFTAKIAWLGLITLFLSTDISFGQSIATFENLSLGTESFWKDTENEGGFENGGAYFYSDYNSEWNMWSGFIYSNSTNTTDGHYTNSYSAITGSGYKNSSNYAVSNGSYTGIKLSKARTISGFYITNTTYAYLTMKNGDSFSKKFGGIEGLDPDYFVLTIYGHIATEKKQDSVNFYLADFRFQNSDQDYIVNTWKWVDLTVLGEIDSLSFDYTTTDNNEYGGLTPAYFAMDNFGDEAATSNVLSKNINWHIYPNPAQEILHISLPNELSEGRIQVSDLSGHVVINQPILSGSTNSLSLQNLKSGAYIVSIQTDNYTSVKTLLKQ
jgi:hypothetical protein